MCWRNRTMTHLLSSFHSVVTSMSPVCLPSGEGELPSRLHAGRRDHQDEIHWTPDRPLPPDMSPPPPSPWSWRRWSAGPSKVVHWTQTFTLSINTRGTVLTHSAAIPVCVVMNSLFLKLWWYNPLNPARDIVVLSDHWYPKKRCVWFSELHLFFLGVGGSFDLSLFHFSYAMQILNVMIDFWNVGKSLLMWIVWRKLFLRESRLEHSSGFSDAGGPKSIVHQVETSDTMTFISG